MALEKELETYNAHVAEWTENTGKFVLIKGDRVVEFFAAYEDAIKAGYKEFGLEPFLVKQINATSAVQHFTRNILPHSTKAA